MEDQHCTGTLAHAPEASGESDGGPPGGKRRTFACCRHRVCPWQCQLRAAAHSVVGANCCGVARMVGVVGPRRMYLPAQINTSAPTRVVPTCVRVQPRDSIQTRRVGVVVLLFRFNAGAHCVAIQIFSLQYVQLFS
jgi:hypothetical protein